MVDSAGWEMPILYRSIHEEHHAVRQSAGLFDVSHMGRIGFAGRHARRMLERVLTRRISDMKPNTCRYALVCNEQGGVKDDVIVYRFDEHWMLVVNACNRTKLLEHFEAVKGDLTVRIEDMTQKMAMVAMQGPKVMDIIGRYSSEVPSLKRFGFCTKNLLVLRLFISRTGYTGEDGVEVILGANMARQAIKLLLSQVPDDVSLTPCGLGARDTLRLEAGMPLYGHELDEDIDPLSAGLDFAVSLDKDGDTDWGQAEPFIGMAALKKIAADGPTRKLVGLKLDGRRTARPHMPVRRGDQIVGEVTSACLSPTLDCPIALAYLDPASADPAADLNIDLGPTATDAHIVPLPFYKRTY